MGHPLGESASLGLGLGEIPPFGYTASSQGLTSLAHAPGVFPHPPELRPSLPLYLGSAALSICNIISRIKPVVKRIRLIYGESWLSVLVTPSFDLPYLGLRIGMLCQMPGHRSSLRGRC
jgi:hypothetical protein